ncbi:MFS transporter [Nocardioides deserti]|uniref:MFS transporter n=1 Tax=Nocardioides deserti TaxID=1588644 RepID=A0ABR6U605_9ACTN|nr:MFS transporter [Nocardioides deserti]MBC2959394.1 MFS transporter [Nocardioides deserti]GGO73378.1 MFS transporter [Nocardioides deserti]
MSVFAIRDYRRLFTAQVIALFGTGLATVALGLLAYELAGPNAAAVLGTALTIKMVLYVVIAPLAAAFVDRLPRRAFLAVLDAIRAVVVLALPFVSEVWHIYVLIALLQAASAAFTPTFQAVIPDIVTNENDYTRALSASQVAYTMESLLSPVLAAVALAFISFDRLFLGTSVGFFASAVLVLSTTIPNARPGAQTNVLKRVSSGMKLFVVTPRLRGLMAFNLVVATGGAIVVVNTVNYVRDVLGGSASEVAWMLAASGGGTLLAALALPRLLDRTPERTVMNAGAGLIALGVIAAVALVATETASYALTAVVWVLLGAGMAMVVTPTGRVIRRSVPPDSLPQAFAAQFSLSHMAWLITYPIAGWMGTSAGLTPTWVTLLAGAVIGAVAARFLWPPETTSPSTSERAPEPVSRSITEPAPTSALDTEAMAGRTSAAAASTTAPVPRAPAAASGVAIESRSAEGTLMVCQCSCGQVV